MGNFEGEPGYPVPGTKDQGPSPETKSGQDFWDYERFKLSPEKIGEIETLYGEYQEKKELFENFGDQIRYQTQQLRINNTAEGWERRQPLNLDKERGVTIEPDGSVSTKETRLERSKETGLSEWVSISPEEQVADIKSALEEKRSITQALIDGVEEINQQKRKEPNNSEFDFWEEYIQIRKAMKESARKVFALTKKYPSLLEYPPLVDNPKFMETMRESLLSEDLPPDHPFKTILKTYVDDYGGTEKWDVLKILEGVGIETSDVKDTEDEKEKRKVIFEKLKSALEHAKEMPAAVRERFLQIAATYVFEGGYKMTPWAMENWANLDIEKFIKTLEERAGKSHLTVEERLMESGDQEIKRKGLEGAARTAEKNPKK